MIYENLQEKVNNFLVYDIDGNLLGVANQLISKRLINIYCSQVEFDNENERNIVWIECPFCGLRKKQLNHHFRKFHPEENLSGIRQHAINSSGLGFPSMWRKKWPELSEDAARKEYQKFRIDHKMNQGWGTGEKNPNHHSKTSENERKIKSPRCIEFYLAKGYSKEEAEKKLANWYKTLFDNMVSSASLQRWIEKFGDEDIAREERRKAYATNKLERYIAKYGEEDGIKRYTLRLKNWANKMKDLSAYGSSKIELDFIHTIIEVFNLNKTECQYRGQYSNIKYVGTLPDFIYKNKKIIEFYGDYWHCNPQIYDKNFENSAGYNIETRKTKDDERNAKLNDAGYEVLVIWEHDWRTNKQLCLEQIKKFLNC